MRIPASLAAMDEAESSAFVAAKRCLPPPIIGGRDRLEMHGNDMGSGHQLRRVLLVSSAQMRPHLVGGLCKLHAHSRELDGKLEARLGRIGLQRRKPDIGHFAAFKN